MILGASPFEHYWADQCRREFAPFADRVTVSFLNALPMDKIRDRVATLELNLMAGTVTPILVELGSAGTASVRMEETRRGPTYRGRHGRVTRVDSSERTTYRLTATV